MNKEKYIRRCIQLAQNGRLYAAPNPMVGAVIVCDDKIIGEGYHVRCGTAHAEVNAIASVKNKELLKRSTIFVSLEPCSHTGKTPPCADLIIKSGIPRVVIGCQDPFSKVAGNGILKLKNAGVQVEVGVLEAECLELIRAFCIFHNQKRPYLILKWAESADGFIDKKRTDGHPVILSSALTSMLGHKRRAEVSAILVGSQTALLDNPSLTTRNWYGPNPLRLVIDRNLTLPKSLDLFNRKHRTVVFTALNSYVPTENIDYVQLDFGQSILPQICTYLYNQNIQSLLVEGGSRLHQSFINEQLWDEIYVEESPVVLQQGVASALLDSKLPHKIEHAFGRLYRVYHKR